MMDHAASGYNSQACIAGDVAPSQSRAERKTNLARFQPRDARHAGNRDEPATLSVGPQAMCRKSQCRSDTQRVPGTKASQRTSQRDTAADCKADRVGEPERLERKHHNPCGSTDTSEPASGDTADTPEPPPGRNRRARPRRSRPDADDLQRCQVVGRLVSELFDAVFEPGLASSAMARRRPRCHMRQIAIYLCHVVLSVPYGTIALAFGRDRSTVAHSCAVVEDRRDDKTYDGFVERCERCVNAVFQPLGAADEQ